MENQVSWVIELAVKPGKVDEFRALMEEMVAGTSEEPLTLNYEWFVSDDGSRVDIYEKYTDSASMVAHVRGFLEKWAGRFSECVDPQRFTVYGNPSEEAKEILAGFGGTYLKTWGGFAR